MGKKFVKSLTILLAFLLLTGQLDVLATSAEAVSEDSAEEDSYVAVLNEKVNLAALKEINNDVLGWIEIPDTELSYPILQSADNDYYLNLTWEGEPDSAGSIFLESQVDPELADFNTIIYGHRMRNLSMFGSLKFYENIDYWEEHPNVYIMIEGATYRYDIYAAYYADPEDITYKLKINSRPKKQELIQFGLDNSVIETGIIPSTFDRILTLSTCTGSGHESRWVVQAVYRMEADTPENIGSTFEGTDDTPDESSKDLADTFLVSDTDIYDAEKQSIRNRSDFYLQAGILIAFIAAAVIIAARHFKNKRKK